MIVAEKMALKGNCILTPTSLLSVKYSKYKEIGILGIFEKFNIKYNMK